MTSTWDKDPILSRITLALLEDTGLDYVIECFINLNL